MISRKYHKLITKAKELHLQGKLEEAHSIYDEAFTYRLEIDDYLAFGYLKMEMNNFYEAEAIFKGILSIVDHPSATFGLAIIDSELGRPHEAIKKYEELMAMNITDPMVYKNVADMYDDIDDSNKAIEYYLKSIEANGDPFWPYTNIGAIYESMNEDKLALSYFLKAYKVNPKEKIISYNLGVVYGKLKQYDLAIKHYLEELGKENHHEMTYYNLALAYKDGYKDYQNAKKYYLLGLQEKQDNYVIWYNLGCVHALLGDYDDAYECFVYLKYKAPDFIKSIDTDDELEAFRKTEQYHLIMG